MQGGKLRYARHTVEGIPCIEVYRVELAPEDVELYRQCLETGIKWNNILHPKMMLFAEVNELVVVYYIPYDSTRWPFSAWAMKKAKRIHEQLMVALKGEDDGVSGKG